MYLKYPLILEQCQFSEIWPWHMTVILTILYSKVEALWDAYMHAKCKVHVWYNCKVTSKGKMFIYLAFDLDMWLHIDQILIKMCICRRCIVLYVIYSRIWLLTCELNFGWTLLKGGSKLYEMYMHAVYSCKICTCIYNICIVIDKVYYKANWL